MGFWDGGMGTVFVPDTVTKPPPYIPAYVELCLLVILLYHGGRYFSRIRLMPRHAPVQRPVRLSATSSRTPTHRHVPPRHTYTAQGSAMASPVDLWANPNLPPSVRLSAAEARVEYRRKYGSSNTSNHDKPIREDLGATRRLMRCMCIDCLIEKQAWVSKLINGRDFSKVVNHPSPEHLSGVF